MLNENVCKGFIKNQWWRKHLCSKRSEVWEQVPIGVPMTANDISKHYLCTADNGRQYEFGSQGVYQLFKSMVALGLAKIEKKTLDKPIKIYASDWEYDTLHETWVTKPRLEPVTIVTEVNIYTRLG